jgi:methyl halide transferase
VSDINTPSLWQAQYERGKDAWDLGGPAPVFTQLAASGRFAPGRMLVPGAGRGHDARAFARHGFQVVAVDFAAFAVREMQRLADPAAPLEIVQHDIFTLPSALDGTFAYVLEHTCFCAIEPLRRREYADLVTRMLAPDGVYIALAFPLSAHVGGPPFAVSVAELLELFHGRGFTLIARETPLPSAPRRRGLEELVVLRKGGVAGASPAPPAG